MSDAADRLSAALADRYRIERELGQGGMATVYLAEDLKHDRKVAVKVLRPELAAVLGAERFVQEIKTTAGLQHPHILPLFDSGKAGGRDGGTEFLYYVMPYIEGETLRQKLDRETQLGIEEAVGITTAIADALDYAHRQNVVHRDIKPENILLQDGRPMVADFGIALAVSAAAGGRMTETGLSLGTPHYMSPEQATAEKDLSSRSDIYSLGAVLYEMLAGEPPHIGGSAQQIIMKIVTDAARPITELRKSVPQNVAAAAAKALEKLPADRFERACDFAEALSNPSFTAGPMVGAAPVARRGTKPWPWIAATAVLGIAAVIGWWPTAGTRPPVTRFTLPPDPAVSTATAMAGNPPIALSPDGRLLALVGPGPTLGVGLLYLRRLDRLEVTPIPGTEGAESPFFSPDGRWIGYFTGTALMKVPAQGGAPGLVADGLATTDVRSQWGDDGFIYLSYPEREAAPGRLPAIGIARIDETGGVPTLIERENNLERSVNGHAVLPGGRVIVYGDCTAWNCTDPRIVARNLETGETTLILDRAARPVLASGLLVYELDGVPFAIRFDAGALRVRGRAIGLSDDVILREGDGAVQLVVSRQGTLAYLQASGGRSAHLVAVDRSGRERQITARPGDYAYPRIDPSGGRIAITVGSPNQQVWIYDVASSTLSQLTFEGQSERPTWSPDGRVLGFSSLRDGTWSVYTRPADASAPATPLSGSLASSLRVTPSWTPDAGWILTDQLVREGTSDDVVAISTTGDSMVSILASEARETVPTVSPNGRWLAYVSNESGPEEIYVRAFMQPGGRWQISADNGDMPLWVSDTELAYIASDRSLTVARLAFGDGVQVLERTSLFPVRAYNLDANAWPYDAFPGGEEFLFIKSPTRENTTVVVLNWAASLKARFEEREE